MSFGEKNKFHALTNSCGADLGKPWVEPIPVGAIPPAVDVVRQPRGLRGVCWSCAAAAEHVTSHKRIRADRKSSWRTQGEKICLITNFTHSLLAFKLKAHGDFLSMPSRRSKKARYDSLFFYSWIKLMDQPWAEMLSIQWPWTESQIGTPGTYLNFCHKFTATKYLFLIYSLSAPFRECGGLTKCLKLHSFFKWCLCLMREIAEQQRTYGSVKK